MASSRKYNFNGDINPFYVDERRQEYLKNLAKEEIETNEQFMSDLKDILNEYCKPIDISDLELESILGTDDIEMVKINSLAAELEAKFNFLKSHSENEKDEQLAKLILGIYD